MKSRVLPILNAVGCLALSGLIATQWRKERADLADISLLRSELTSTRDRLAEGATHAAALAQDIAALKETLGIARKSNEEATRILAGKNTQTENLQTELSAAREQVKSWEAAIAARDAKLRDLNAELTATRARLNEAIAKLKAAGAR